MPERKIEDYLEKDPQYLTALIALKVDGISEEKLPAITTHLEKLNNKVSKNHERISKLEIIAEVEDKYGLIKLPMNKKKMVATGGGAIALITALVYIIVYILSVTGVMP